MIKFDTTPAIEESYKNHLDETNRLYGEHLAALASKADQQADKQLSEQRAHYERYEALIGERSAKQAEHNKWVREVTEADTQRSHEMVETLRNIEFFLSQLYQFEINRIRNGQ